jgi:general secretion pathway protein K
VVNFQRGAAVILAMLTLALMAEIAALVVADYGATMELLVGRQDQGQSRWLARAAVDWARNVLSEDKRTSKDLDHPGEIWATRIAPTPVEDGEVAGEIVDYSGFFNLNSLVDNGGIVPPQLEAYKRLLAQVGFTPNDAVSLAAALADWLDADNEAQPGGAEATWYAEHGRHYRPANALLLDVDELRLVRGYTDDVVGRLRAVAVALPDSKTPLNVNSAGPEVLCAVIANLTPDQARALVAHRGVTPFTKIAGEGGFMKQLPSTAIAPASDRLAVTSRYFLVGGRAKYGQAVTRMQVLLDRETRWSTIVWQKIL